MGSSGGSRKRKGDSLTSAPSPKKARPTTWSVKQVEQFVLNSSLKSHAPAFVSEKIDGEALAGLTQLEMKGLGIHKLGERRQLEQKIDEVFRAEDDAFKLADTNQDGRVDLTEYLAAGGTRAQFTRADKNNDGVIELAEWRAAGLHTIADNMHYKLVSVHSAIEEWEAFAEGHSEAVTVSSRLLTTLADVLLLCCITFLGYAVHFCWGLYEDDFGAGLRGSLTGQKQGVTELLVLLCGDLGEAGALGLCSLALLAVLSGCFVLGSRGQSIGLLLHGNCLSTENGQKRAGPLSTGLWMMCNIICTPFDLVREMEGIPTHLADSCIGVVLRPTSAVQHAVVAPPIPAHSGSNLQQPTIDRNQISKRVRSERVWRDYAGVAIFVGSQIIIFAMCEMWITRYNPLRRGADLSGSSTLEGFFASWWFWFWGNVAQVCMSQWKPVVISLTATYLYLAVFFSLARAFLFPLFYALTLLFFTALVGYLLVALAEDQGGIAFITGVILLVAASTAKSRWSRWMLTLECWRMAILGMVSHPISLFHVPVLEACYQCYQFVLFTRLFMVAQASIPRSDLHLAGYQSMLTNALCFLQLFTVFTLRCCFQIATSNVIAAWYFRLSSESSTVRSFRAIVQAHTTSFGSACYAGLFQFVINIVVTLYRKLDKECTKRSWANPAKYLFWFLSFLVGIVAKWLEILAGYTLVYVGMYGDSYYTSAHQAFQLMKSEAAQAIDAALATQSLFSYLVCSAMTIMYPINTYVIGWALSTYPSRSPELLDWAFVQFICYYFFLTSCWTLKIAMDTVLVCATEEIQHVPRKNWAAPVGLHKIMATFTPKYH